MSENKNPSKITSYTVIKEKIKASYPHCFRVFVDKKLIVTVQWNIGK